MYAVDTAYTLSTSFTPFPIGAKREFSLSNQENLYYKGASKGSFGLELGYVFSYPYILISPQVDYKKINFTYSTSNDANTNIAEDSINTIILYFGMRSSTAIFNAGLGVGYAFHKFKNYSHLHKKSGSMLKWNIGLTQGKWDFYLSIEKYMLGNNYRLIGRSLNLRYIFI